MDTLDALINQANFNSSRADLIRYEWEEPTRGIKKVHIKAQEDTDPMPPIPRPGLGAICTIILKTEEAQPDDQCVAKIFDEITDGAGPKTKGPCFKILVDGPFKDEDHMCKDQEDKEDCVYPSIPTTPEIGYVKVKWRGGGTTIFNFKEDKKKFAYIEIELEEVDPKNCCMIEGEGCKV